MKVKVIKEIKGLVPGDILYYNKANDLYEISKTDYDIGDTTSTKTVKFAISDYLVGEFNDYFVYVDDEDNNIELSKIYWDDFPRNDKTVETPTEKEPEVKNEDSKNSEITKLQKQVEELEKKLEDVERDSIKVGNRHLYVNPFGYHWF